MGVSASAIYRWFSIFAEARADFPCRVAELETLLRRSNFFGKRAKCSVITPKYIFVSAGSRGCLAPFFFSFFFCLSFSLFSFLFILIHYYCLLVIAARCNIKPPHITPRTLSRYKINSTPDLNFALARVSIASTRARLDSTFSMLVYNNETLIFSVQKY